MLREDERERLGRMMYDATAAHLAEVRPGPPIHEWADVPLVSREWFRVGATAVATALLPPGTIAVPEQEIAAQEDIRALAVRLMRDDLIGLCRRQAEASRKAANDARRVRAGLSETIASACDATAERCEFMAGCLAELFPDTCAPGDRAPVAANAQSHDFDIPAMRRSRARGKDHDDARWNAGPAS